MLLADSTVPFAVAWVAIVAAIASCVLMEIDIQRMRRRRRRARGGK